MNHDQAAGLPADLFVERRGAGPPLLLVHGFPLDHTMWRFQLEGLSELCEVLAPDLRGFGSSGVVEGTLTMEQCADDLAGMLDKLIPATPVVLCGLSMGGYVAWQFYRKHAERLAGLILCDTRAAADAEPAAEARRSVAAQVLRDGSASIAGPMSEKLFSTSSQTEFPDRVLEVQRVIERTDPRSIAAAQLGMAERPDMTFLLPETGIPTLVLCGSEDAITPAAEMEQMAGQMPQATFVSIERAGHLAPLEQPADVNEAMSRFLLQVYSL